MPSLDKVAATAILYCFTFLYLAAAGGGAWSVDELRGRKL